MTREIRTPYGTIYQSGDRELFAGSREELETARHWAERAERRDNLVALINTYNESSSPSVARTDAEHKIERDRARIALSSIRRNYIEGTDYRELSNGALWPTREEN
jgi:hypothetical protein